MKREGILKEVFMFNIFKKVGKFDGNKITYQEEEGWNKKANSFEEACSIIDEDAKESSDGTRIGRYGKNKSLVRYLYATGDGRCTGIKISASEYNIKRSK